MAAAAPHRIEIVLWGQPKTVSGFTFTRNQASSVLGGGASTQASAAEATDGDSLAFDVLLDSGTWAIDVIYVKASSYGIMDFDLGGASLGTIDGYNSSTTLNNVTTISGVTVATAGHYTLTMTINGKHAWASDYFFGLQYITLRRTGA